MQVLPPGLQALTRCPQFINYKLVPKPNGKTDKVPVNIFGGEIDAHTPSNWLSYDEAAASQSPVGFVFTENDPFFFLDIDDCLTPENQWSDDAKYLMGVMSGAAVEISQSRRGLHIFGCYASLPSHSCESKTMGASLFTKSRFVALTSDSVVGSCDVDCTKQLHALIDEHYQPKIVDRSDWTTEPRPGWGGEGLDTVSLIEKAIASKSTSGRFGNTATFEELWDCDEDALARHFPDDQGIRVFDGSAADAALAQHLAFWTGCNCDYIEHLMRQSGLMREKYDRPDYLFRTITRAVSLQTNIYEKPPEADRSVLEKFDAVKLSSSSEAQLQFAENVRCEKLASETDPEIAQQLAQVSDAKTIITNKDKTAAEIVEATKPVSDVAPPETAYTIEPRMVQGFQLLAADKQVELFKGCVYIQDIHRVFTPKGLLLKSEQFNATYGGYVFQLDSSGKKDTRKPWDAFTESQVVRFPKVETTCFRPTQPPGSIIEIDGYAAVNTYVPINTRRHAGNPEPFLKHMQLLIPDERDRQILMSYMSACVQYPGVKFQWCPLVQGIEGNGKTLLSRCVAFALGEKYTHFPPAQDISEKFNAWMFGKLFIGVEDIRVFENRQEVLEVLKPMITGDRLAKREMQQSQVMSDSCANFLLNSNYKDGIQITDRTRRYAPFFSAQQEKQDLIECGMGGDYFPRLYNWLKADGYAIVNELLHTYAIQDEFNPAVGCQRVPETSSTREAIQVSLGGIEQEIQEAIEESRPGFSGGWVSSVALERLLFDLRATRRLPPNKRRDVMRSLGYDYHPALKSGRVNNPVSMDGNKKPRLYVKTGHLALNMTSPSEISRAYQESQCYDPAAQIISEKFK